MNRNPKLATARHVRAAPSSRSLNAGSHAAVTQVEGGAADIEFAASPASAARRVGGGHTGVHGAGAPRALPSRLHHADGPQGPGRPRRSAQRRLGLAKRGRRR